MKYKLKELNFSNLKYNKSDMNESKLISFTYLDNELEFQTPKVILEKIIQEDNKEYLLLKLLPTEASKTFQNGINNLEDSHNKIINLKNWFNYSLPRNGIKSVINGDSFIVKIPFKYSKPTLKIYSKNGSLFNYYHLKSGMELICLLDSSKLWINFDNSVTYNLSVKEILITKTI